MSRVSVDYFELEKIRRNAIIGSGMETICYQYDKEHVLKLFRFLLANRKIYFEGLTSPNIAFPIDIYEYRETGLIQGIFAQRFYGNNLKNGFKEELDIKTLLDAYNEIRKELINHSDIKIMDINSENVLFDKKNKSFRLIETTNWVPSSLSTDANLKKLDDLLMQTMCFYNLGIDENFLFTNPYILEIYNRWFNGYDIKDNEIFPEFLSEIQSVASHELGKVKTIGELRRK